MSGCLKQIVNSNFTGPTLCLCSRAEVWRMKPFILPHISHLPLPSLSLSILSSLCIAPSPPPSRFLSLRGGVMGACYVWINRGMMTSLPSSVTIATPANREMPLSSPWLSDCPVSIPPSFLPSFFPSLPCALPVPTLSALSPKLLIFSSLSFTVFILSPVYFHQFLATFCVAV